ncbi:MAG: hypothetical protein HY858_15405 [Candidatus Solibacter usitatus]|nr:hypothetical protein [Candidatus Solibacter usitatus]
MLHRIALALLAFVAAAQTPPLLPLKDVRAGMKITGRTVFSGSRVEEFQGEILGVLENSGPKQSIILARLSGGPLDKTGVMQGMSGSPVYYQGRLMGAVALSFPFSKDPVAGIRPIEEMLQAAAASPRRSAALSFPYDATESLPKRQELDVGPARLAEIATPFWLSGFTRGAVEFFAPALRTAGLEPVQGVSGGGRPVEPTSASQKLEPGSMISVQLVSGDMSVGADGTVTHIDGRNVYAFGHRFLSVGDTDLPFARAEVITLLASQNSSFKISTPKEWLGSITSDRSTAISGQLGRKAVMLPLTIRVRSRGVAPREWSYQMNMVQDRLFTPLLLQMAVFSAIDATERTAGAGSISLRGRMLMDGAPPVRIDNIYASELGAPQQVSAAVAAPVVAILQSGFDALKLRGLEIELDVSPEKKQLQLDNVWASRREVRPGETVEIMAAYSGDHGTEVTRTVSYAVPNGAPAGALFFTVTDGPSSNLAEYRQFLLTPPRSAPQLLSFLSGLHPSDRPYLRVWRQSASWQVQGENLPSPPPSMSLTLGRTAAQQPTTRVAEIEMARGDSVFAGSKTVQVDVKE